MLMAVEERVAVRELVERLIPAYESMAASTRESLAILRGLATALGVRPELVRIPVEVPRFVYEVYDLVEKKKLAVATTQKDYEIINKDFKVLLATAEGTDVQVDFSSIVADSYKVLRGSTYTMTRKKKKVDKLYFKGTASGTLWITVWR